MGRLPDLAAIDITPQLEVGTKIIHGYGDGYVNISGEKLTHDVIITPTVYKEYTCHDDVLEFLDEGQIVLYGCDDENLSFRAAQLGGVESSKHLMAKPFNKEQKPLKNNSSSYKYKLDSTSATNGRSLNDALRSSVHIETMSFAAACRTYNVLVSEGRSVIAILRFNHG